MSGVLFRENLGDVEKGFIDTITKFKRRSPRAVRDTNLEGFRKGRASARRTAGSHGKLYPRAWSTERNGPLEYEYGPDASKPQGAMSFEGGSRNQPPHLDAAKSAEGLADSLERRLDLVVKETWSL